MWINVGKNKLVKDFKVSLAKSAKKSVATKQNFWNFTIISNLPSIDADKLNSDNRRPTSR